MGFQSCLYTAQVFPPTCASYGNLSQVKKDMASLHKHVGLGTAVKVGVEQLVQKDTNSTILKPVEYSYFNPYTCNAEEVIIVRLLLPVHQLILFYNSSIQSVTNYNY